MHCTHVFIRHIGSSLVCVSSFPSMVIGMRTCSWVSSSLSLYFVLKSFFHLFLNPAMVPDENSMEDPLCNSSFGSMVSLDYVTPDTSGNVFCKSTCFFFFSSLSSRIESTGVPWVSFQGVLPASCIVRAERLNSGETLYERQYLSPRPPPKISLRHDLNWNKGQDQGFTVEHRPVGKLVQQSLGETVQFGSSKPTQTPISIEDRSGRPVTQKIVSVLQEEPSSSDRPGRPVSREEQHVRNHDDSGKPDGEEIQHAVQEYYHVKSRDNVDKFDLATDDANVDFSISGIPEEAVKRSENFNILQLIRRITRHPQQEAVQNDLDKEQSFNAFRDESRECDQGIRQHWDFRDHQCGTEVAMQVLPQPL